MKSIFLSCLAIVGPFLFAAPALVAASAPLPAFQCTSRANSSNRWRLELNSNPLVVFDATGGQFLEIRKSGAVGDSGTIFYSGVTGSEGELPFDAFVARTVCRSEKGIHKLTVYFKFDDLALVGCCERVWPKGAN